MLEDIRAKFGTETFVAGAPYRLPGCPVERVLRPKGMSHLEAAKSDAALSVNSTAFENLVAKGVITHVEGRTYSLD